MYVTLDWKFALSWTFICQSKFLNNLKGKERRMRIWKEEKSSRNGLDLQSDSYKEKKDLNEVDLLKELDENTWPILK